MTSVPHETGRGVRERPRVPEWLVPEVWASAAIGMIWLAVLFDAVFGPDIVSSSGSTQSVVPSAVVVVVFAFLATWVVAKYGLRRRD